MKVTQKNLLNAFPKLSQKNALLITRLVNGTIDPLSLEAGSKRYYECYNRPSDTDLILNCINAILDGYGVEGTPYYENAMRDGQFIEYVNRGDTYTVTILFNPGSNRFEISDWGSVYETSPEYAAQTEMEGE